jgi:nitrite reductase/ring-hydroxylating ferredoxin subunit
VRHVTNEAPVDIAKLLARRTRTQWWPVALSEQVDGRKPLGVVCDGEPIVLYRDATGHVRALEDRCRHRRAPLSLGRVTADGRLQCGYHGWTYDGLSGACTGIPNLSAQEPVPAHYAARAYGVSERGGFVFVHAHSASGEGAAGGASSDALPDEIIQRERADGRPFRGSVTVATRYEDYLAALADGPHLLMRYAGLRITNYVSVDPVERDGRVAMERGVVWAARRRNHRFVTVYPWTIKFTGEHGRATLTAELFTRDEERAMIVTMGIAPAARGATAVHWRGAVLSDAGGLDAVWLRAWMRARRVPFEMFSSIDGHALARLERLYSNEWLRHWQAESRNTGIGGKTVDEPCKGNIDGEYSV